MSVRIRHVLAAFGWWQWLVAGVFLLALIAAGLFAVRTVRHAIYWRQHQDEPIARWMTVGYVAHSYDVPPEVLLRALGVPEPRPPARPDRRPLGEIAAAQGKTFEEISATLRAAIDEARPPQTAPLRPPAPRPPGSDRGGP
ncbi:MAG: hypothetical protein WC273_01055 [Dehalococcoidia bacterium]